ncbi:MAG TPA: type II secretion system protein [Thermodesulfobacteriota bacterium]|nr:type II secretion system protein [Thermodesulfobacteriota bacterium]
MEKKPADKGFTLMEIMVAVAILGIALTVIMELFSGGLRLVRKSQEYSRAVFYGRQLLEELCLKKEFLGTVEEGVFAGSEYRWRYEVEPVFLVDGEKEKKFPLNIFKIKIFIFWPDGDKEKNLVFETIKTNAKSEDENFDAPLPKAP